MQNNKGHRLRVARKAAGLSQKQLGEQLGLEQAFISRVERGASDGTVNFWRDLARLLNVSLDYLLTDQPAPRLASVDEPMRMNKLAVVADYTLPQGLRDLAMDNTLCDTLQISPEEWTQMAIVPFLEQANKDAFLQLLITLRNMAPPSSSVTAS